jgi:two-component system sensor histidine kinase AtoS
MEPQSVATLILDQTGAVRSANGSLGDVSFAEGTIGRAWSDCFQGWVPSPSLPDQPDELVRRSRSSTPEGFPAVVDIIALPDATPDRAFAVIIRADEVSTLPLRLQQLCNVGEVSCGISHEMNNALTILCGWLDVMRGDLTPDSTHLPTVDLLRDEASRLAVLSRNLQEVARGDVNGEEDLDVVKLLSEVTGLVRHEMERSRIRIETRWDENIPKVHGNSGRLKQALLNLLVNARQAMPEGGRITLTADGNEGDHVNLIVEDTGTGIPMEYQTRVFRTFFTTKPDGTGLGLPITRRIVEDHRGTIELESQPGRGSRFTIRLPAGSGL